MIKNLQRYWTACVLAWLGCIVFLTGPAAAAGPILDLSAQSENVRGWVDEALSTSMAPWDEAAGMFGGGKSHGSRQNMLFAAGYILRNRPEDIERAQRAIRAVLKLQYDAPGKEWHGTYKLNEREPDQPKRTLFETAFDENWREFIGTAQIVLLEGCSSRLEPALREEMLTALQRACEGAHARDVSWRYTNIAIMNAWLLSWGGRRFGEPAWSKHGAELAGKIHKEFARCQTFQEYNSPTYSGTDLYALALWRTLPVFPEMAVMAREMEAGLWRDLARHYHAGLGNLCGPFDRSYGMDMRKYLAKSSICVALALDMPSALPDRDKVEHHGFEMTFAPLMAVLGMNMPEDAAVHFRAFQGPRRFDQVIERGEHTRIAQSWMEETFMAGAEQTGGAGYGFKTAIPFTLHWKTPEADLGWMRLLKDSPVEPKIVGDTVEFSLMREKPALSSRFLELEVYAPGATAQSFQETCWELPGMPLSVESRLTPPSIETTNAGFMVRYTLPRTKSPEALLKLRINAATTPAPAPQ